MRAGSLRFKASFLVAQTSTLGHELDYSLKFSRQCDVQEVRYTETETQSLQIAEDLKRFTVRYDNNTKTVNQGWRIRFDGDDYNVVRVNNTDRFKKMIRFDAVRIDG